MSDLNQNDFGRKEKKKKALLILFFLLFSVLLLIGIVSAFFSDIVSQTGDLTTGTLKLDAAYTLYLNGEETQFDNLNNLNPGDVIVIEGMISNTGSKSAWVRDEITFSSQELLPYIKVYDGVFSQADLVSQDLSDFLISLSESGVAYTDAKVINGTGANAETESGGGYNYVNDSEYTVTLTVYFMHSAGNEAQAKTMDFTVASKAIQFRNNNTALPDENAWTAVTAVGA